MIDFSNSFDWQKIKNEIMQAIPPIPAGAGKYNEWIARIGNFRQAGYQLEEVQVWCGADGDLTEDKFNQAPGSESELEARKILFTIASKNGYVCNHEGTHAVTPQRYKMPKDEASTDDAINNTIKLFNSMYSPEDVVYICNGRHSPQQNKIVPDGGSIVGVKVNTFTPEVLKGFLQFDKGMYIQYNQVDETAFNQYKQTKKNGSIKNEHITSFKYAYIEADPPEGVDFREFFNESIKKLESMDLPWIAHVFSGNKSIHTVVRLDANTQEEYKERLTFIHNYCKKCGYEIDDAVKNTARWGRFPCCKRGNSYQYIMEINPAPCSFDSWKNRHTAPANPLLDGKGNVDSASMLEFINQLGFASCIDGDDAVLVQIEGKMVEKIKTKKMIGIVNEAIKASDPLILSKTQTFLGGKSANYFANLPFVDITNHTDSSEAVYLYYNNCFIEITQNEVIQHDYSDMQGFLWKGLIPSMKRDYTPADNKESIYEKFINNITSNKTDSGFSPNQKAKKSAETIIGYLMSRNKKASEAKAVLLTEKGAGAIEADAVGGTGKGIFIQALEQFRVDGEIDGKDLRSEDRFAFSAYQDGQSIYVIQDVQASFDIRNLYNKITNKFIVEKKGQNKRIIPFAEAPKVVITSNYILRGLDEGSTARRLHIVELENYYSDTFSPADEFNCNFFTADWNDSEWNRFDAYIIHCIQQYLSLGVLTYTTEQLEAKKKEASVVGNIDTWWEDWVIGYTIGKGSYTTSHKVEAGEFYSSITLYKLYKEWCAENKIFTKLNQITFCRKLKNYLGDLMLPERSKKERGWSFIPNGIPEPDEEAPF